MFWRVRTGLMFVLMTIILTAIGCFVGYIFGTWSIGVIIMLIASALIGAYSYFFSKKAALRANKAHIITEAEEPRLYSIVRNLSDKAGLPMPEVGISETSMPNAFATGRNPKDAAVVATRGILSLLPDDELEGVFAHELSHVRNRDILVMSVVSTMAAVVSYTAQFASYMVLFSGDRERRGEMFLIAMALSITAPIAALLIQLGVSRSREYLADESAANITRNPRALARALRHIESGCNTTEEPYVNKSYANLMICNPLTGKNRTMMSSMFSTHPPTEERIRRLNEIAEKFDSEKGNKPAAASSKDAAESSDYTY